jgi:hypothetical protein
MRKLSSKIYFNPRRRQSAQGMVEFALVLPILLLVLMGIIGFGHLLFSYTMIVAASREAARYGVATGLSDKGIPRFRDCDEIRAAAARVGAVAGVTVDAINIAYDQGPPSDGTPATLVAPVSDCPIGGIGPGNIDIGDRIVVTVNVGYRTIVPLVPIPDIPIQAETSRTIINTIPIGDAPIASGSKCIGTIVRLFPDTWALNQTVSTSKVGEPVVFDAEVIADNPSVVPPGTLSIYMDDANYTTAFCSVTTGGTTSKITCNTPPKTWTSADVGDHLIRAQYDPGANATTTPCYDASKAEPWKHTVIPADTEIQSAWIVVNDLSYVDTFKANIYQAEFTVDVKTLAPGGGAPIGTVVLKEGATVLGSFPVTAVTGFTDLARGTSPTISFATAGKHTVTAIFGPATGYNSSSANSASFTLVAKP